MSTITVSLPSDGDTIDAADYNTPINIIVNDYNGNITNDNISASAAIAGSKLGTGAAGVGNANLLTTTGDIGGAWKSWTPSVTNFTGTLTYAKYTQIGKTVIFKVKYTMGGNDDVGAGPTFSLPVTGAAIGDYLQPIGQTMIKRTAGGFVQGTTHLLTTTTFSFFSYYISASFLGGNYISLNDVTAILPYDWAANDTLMMMGTYEAA